MRNRVVSGVLLLAVVFAMMPARVAPAQGAGDFVRVEGGQLVYKGQVIKLKGVNFYPRNQPWAYMWTQWDGAAAQSDLARAKELGVNSVRIMVPYSPATGWTDKDTGKVPETYVNELRQMVQIAGDMDMKVIVALFDFYDPGKETLTKVEAERRNKLYIDSVVGAFANDDRVMAWDLHNEPDQYGSWKTDNRQKDFISWMAMVAQEIKKVDSNHLITVGMSLYDSLFVADNTGAPYPDEAARGLSAADLSDFLSFHSYNAGNIDWQIKYIKLHSDKPIVLEETGWPTGPSCTDPIYVESQQELLYRLMLAGANSEDIAGVMNWQLWDFPPGISAGSGKETHEDYFGLLRQDGTWKPAMALFRDGWPGDGTSAKAVLLPSQTKTSLAFTKQPPPAVPNSPQWVPPLFFPETGHYAYGLFRDYWNNFGGLEIFGYPLTEQRLEGGLWVQYYERARFEYHPEYAKTVEGWDKMSGAEKLKFQIQITRLGADQVDKMTEGEGYPSVDPLYLNDRDYAYFPQTRQAIWGPIKAYWESHNGLINFGYALSRPFPEVSAIDGKTYTVQYFERTRLEVHPENAGTPYEVQLGLMGKELLVSRGCR
ncbi:MAG: cellulase family glycosylhydrolase [Chloroflexia bacterium]